MTRGGSRFDRVATATAEAAGTPWAFAAFIVAVLLWLVTGPILGFSAGWQLLINTPTTIATTGLVFLVQYTQNKNDRALHLKLDVLIDASGASNRYASVEDLDDQELRTLRERVVARIAEADPDGDGVIEG